MNILAVGDIVGSAGIRKLKKELPQIIEKENIGKKCYLFIGESLALSLQL